MNTTKTIGTDDKSNLEQRQLKTERLREVVFEQVTGQVMDVTNQRTVRRLMRNVENCKTDERSKVWFSTRIPVMATVRERLCNVVSLEALAPAHDPQQEIGNTT